MRKRSRTPLALLAVLASLIPAGAANAAAAPTPAPPLSRGSAAFRTITLVTGDRISVAADGSDRVSMLDTSGHRNTQFLSRTVGGHLQVIPTTAMDLLARGKLDPRLFDVTELLADGYDDRAANLPLLVSYQTGASPRGTSALAGLTVRRELTAVGAIAVRQPRATATAAWTALTSGPAASKSLRPGIRKIWLDGIMRPSLDVSVPQIGAPAAWKAGYDGTGVTVGIIDTGVDATHPDLAGKVIEAKGFTDTGDTVDSVGHGTHVASTVAGTGAASNGTYKGVAPGASLYAAKVCGASGCPESAVLAGMQWVAEKGVRVANMSLGGANQPGRDPIEDAVENLTAKYGTLFVAASGNDHLWTGSPASAPSALAVGAVDKQDVAADFSSHGIKYDDYAVKPELTAPGVDITAARSKDGPDGATLKYRTLSGTSMAAPHVSGAAALLAQAHPTWTHDQLKDALVSSATPNRDPWFVQGAGRVDVARAFSQAVVASPSTLAFGLQKLPHDQDPPVSKTVNYHNSGTTPITLSLTIPASDAAGKPLPAGLFTVAQAEVTVPAGGEAPVTVIATPAAIPWKDVVGAVLTATGGGVTIRTPMSMAAQIEGFDLTVTGLDRDGDPSAKAYTTIYPLSEPVPAVDVWGSDGVGTARLRAGKYMLTTQVLGGTAAAPQVTMLVIPQLTVDKDQAVTMDARLGKPVSLSVPKPDAVTRLAHVGSIFHNPAGWYPGDSVTARTFDGVFTAQVGPDAPDPQTAFDLSSTLEQGRTDGDPYDSPYAYYLAYYAKAGTFFTGFGKKVSDRDLDAVATSYSAQAPNSLADSYAYYKPSFDRSQMWSVPSSFGLPIRRTEYFSAEGDVQWQKYLLTKLKAADGTVSPLTIHQSLFTQHTPGRGRDQWTAAVFGPGLKFVPQSFPFTSRGLTRNGNQLKILPSLLSDNTGREAIAPGRGTLTVVKDGTVLRSLPVTGAFVEAPADPGTFAVTVTQTRADPDVVASSVAVTWTFQSAHTTSLEALPISVIRFTPPLDSSNTAPPAWLSVVPFTVDHQGTAGVSTSSGVQVSYDDGKTWSAAPVISDGDRGVALLRHPAGHGYVSLKGSASDARGNAVEQTVLRAYRF